MKCHSCRPTTGAGHFGDFIVEVWLLHRFAGRYSKSTRVVLGDSWEQRPLARQLPQDYFKPLAKNQTGRRQAPAVQLLPLVFQDSALPINVCVSEVRGIGLRRADEPQQLKIQLPFVIHGPHESDVFGLRDGALGLFRHLRPHFARQDGRWNPAHAQGVVVAIQRQ